MVLPSGTLSRAWVIVAQGEEDDPSPLTSSHPWRQRKRFEAISCREHVLLGLLLAPICRVAPANESSEPIRIRAGGLFPIQFVTPSAWVFSA